MLALLVAARRAGFALEDAWRLTTTTALAYMSDRRAAEWWDVLASTRAAWEDACADRRSPLALLPRPMR